jgi:2Fe-2S ferredoxin
VPEVVYIDPSGIRRSVDADAGDTVMTAAVRNGVPGIVGECGGHISCATCHVWLRPEYVDLSGEIGNMEEDLLDLGVAERRQTSRLGCQVVITDELDGLTVDVPPPA